MWNAILSAKITEYKQKCDVHGSLVVFPANLLITLVYERAVIHNAGISATTRAA